MARSVRESVIRLATDGGCFLGASLSAVEIIVYLYRRFLSVGDFHDPSRDYFFLSKGHDVPALYATFVELGWLDRNRLVNHLRPYDDIYWHPNRAIPGVEFHSGSLGHLLSVATGVAWDVKARGQQNRVVVLVGDGELNEGSNWEALLVAHALRLQKLLIVVDRNGFQANERTEALIPLEPLQSKFLAFGCGVQNVNGHDFLALENAFSKFPLAVQGPSVIIADTVRGKGLPSIEGRADRWFCNFTGDEIEALLRELDGKQAAEMQTPGLMVR
jgi:transketolase